MYSKLADYGVRAGSEHAVQHESLHDLMGELDRATAAALKMVEEMRGEMLTAVERNIAGFNTALMGLLGRLNSEEFVDTSQPPAETLAKLAAVDKQLGAIRAGLEKSIEYENQFREVRLCAQGKPPGGTGSQYFIIRAGDALGPPQPGGGLRGLRLPQRVLGQDRRVVSRGPGIKPGGGGLSIAQP